MAGIAKTLERLAPAQALAEIAVILRKILPLLPEEERRDFVIDLIGGAGDDKVASMVHL